MKPLKILLTTAMISTLALAADQSPRLNQIQVIGTHNSYHIAPSPTYHHP